MVRQIGRMHSDLWHQEKLITPGIKLDVQLLPARPAFFIKDSSRRSKETGAGQVPHRERPLLHPIQRALDCFGNEAQGYVDEAE